MKFQDGADIYAPSELPAIYPRLIFCLSRTIAKIHNAKIEVHSELGKGSEFEIIFAKMR
ncbi:hypothetical protein [Helicobacter sp. 23-1045]